MNNTSITNTEIYLVVFMVILTIIIIIFSIFAVTTNKNKKSDPRVNNENNKTMENKIESIPNIDCRNCIKDSLAKGEKVKCDSCWTDKDKMQYKQFISFYYGNKLTNTCLDCITDQISRLFTPSQAINNTQDISSQFNRISQFCHGVCSGANPAIQGVENSNISRCV